jgi:Kef-type K+ transport system membrane component KefB
MSGTADRLRMTQQTAVRPSVADQGQILRPARRPVRTVLVYAALVVVPVAVAAAFLARSGSRTAVTGGHPVPAATVAWLLLAVAVIVSACAAVGVLCRRIGQPPVVGEIATGIVLGPSVFGALWPAGFGTLFAPAVTRQIDTLAQLGVVLFVFVAGLELSPRLLRGKGDVALVVSHVSIAVPFLLGVVLAVAAFPVFAPAGVGFLPFALFLGVSMSITALPVMARILKDRGMYHSHVGVVSLTSALVDDVTAWTLLALVVALTRGHTAGEVLVTIVLTAAFAAAVLLVVPRTSARLGTRLEGTALLVPVSLGVALLCAAATDRIGVHAIFGAFLLGIACPAEHPAFTAVRERVGGITTTLLLPLFFAYSGLRTDLRSLGADPRLWVWCAVVLVVATAGKLGAAALAARTVGVAWRPALRIGALMNCRGLTELVILNVGLELGVLNRSLFTIMVLMALGSTAMTAPLLSVLGRSPAPSDK